MSIGRREEREMKVCATSQESALDGVRKDLLDRLCTLPVWLPPLRRRGLDILYLADLELEVLAGRGQQEKRLTREGRELLLAHGWPGNVRQLQNVIRCAVARSRGGTVLAPGLLLKCEEESEWVEA
ncbi:MAG TPA: hypothetical protein VE173_11175, partial [Longimicrobiales bacterium]|nr:hypothetical protein [Longimicrobiales bacterium]